MSDQAKFFEYGEVCLELSDFNKRQAVLKVCVPCCVLLATTPSLLGGGVIDKFNVRNPVAVWLPKFGSDRFHDIVNQQIPGIEHQVHGALENQMKALVHTFMEASHLFKTPADMISALPLGTYVEFQYRCDLDGIAKALLGISRTPGHGIGEFAYALATVLNHCLLVQDTYKPKPNLFK